MHLCCLSSSQHSGELASELCWIQLYRKTNGEVVLEPTVPRTSVRKPLMTLFLLHLLFL